jgi:hypothetical protein
MFTVWPADRTLSLNASCEITVPDMSGEFTATDNCGTTNYNQSIAAGTTIASGEGTTHNVTITIDDGNGNSVQQVVVLTGDDDTDPNVTVWQRIEHSA